MIAVIVYPLMSVKIAFGEDKLLITNAQNWSSH